MKNYLYRFEFFSGFYESYFYRQVRAKDEKDAIIQIVSYFNNNDEQDAQKYLSEELGADWNAEIFWQKMNLKFSSGTEGYTLIWIKKIDFDLDTVGRFI